MISQPAILTNHRTPFTLLESFSFGTLMGAENIHASRFTLHALAPRKRRTNQLLLCKTNPISRTLK